MSKGNKRMLFSHFWNAHDHAFILFNHTKGHFIKLRIPFLSLCWMNPLFLMWAVKIYKLQLIFPFSIFCHIVLTSLQLKYAAALSLTFNCCSVRLINLHDSQAPASHHRLSTTMCKTLILANPTQLSDQTQLHVPFISTGAPWPHGSSVNLWS